MSRRSLLLLVLVPVLLLLLVVGLVVVVAIVFTFRRSSPSLPSPSAPAATCVPYTKETRCIANKKECLSYTAEVKSAGWYMMAETGKCEEKMYDGCNYPTCDPATHFETKAECETACIKRSWPELVGRPKDEARAVVVAESPIHTTVSLRDRDRDGEPSSAIFILSRVVIDYDPTTGLVSSVPRVG